MIPIADFYLAKEIGAAIIHFFKRKNGVKKTIMKTIILLYAL